MARRLKPWWFAGALVLLAPIAACDRPTVTYIKSGTVPRSEAHAFVKLPEEWTLYEEDDLLAGDGDLTEEQRASLEANQWLVIFDASPDPTPQHLSPFSEFPTGFALVRALNPLQEGDYSVDSLRNEVFPLDELESGDDFELHSDERLDLPGDMEGFRLTFSLGQGERVSKVQQVSALDPAADVIYVLVISCEATCYENEEDVIDRVVRSWTVEEALR
jgi:hypothetical protein